MQCWYTRWPRDGTAVVHDALGLPSARHGDAQGRLSQKNARLGFAAATMNASLAMAAGPSLRWLARSSVSHMRHKKIYIYIYIYIYIHELEFSGLVRPFGLKGRVWSGSERLYYSAPTVHDPDQRRGLAITYGVPVKIPVPVNI